VFTAAAFRRRSKKAFPEVLAELQQAGPKLGVLANRDREFMEHEIDAVGGSGWRHFFDTMVCGDDVSKRKPAPDAVVANSRELLEMVRKFMEQ